MVDADCLGYSETSCVSYLLLFPHLPRPGYALLRKQTGRKKKITTVTIQKFTAIVLQLPVRSYPSTYFDHWTNYILAKK